MPPAPQFLRSALVVAIVLIAGPAVAQAEFSLQTPGGQRPFATPLYWLNLTPDIRLPIRERLLGTMVGLNAMTPPSPRRAGLTPWISTTAETGSFAGIDDNLLTFAPGFTYRRNGPRLQFQAEYALEGAAHSQSDLSRPLESHGGYADLTYALSERSQLGLFDLYSDSRDTGDALVQQAILGATRLTSNTLVAAYRFKPSPREKLELAYRNSQYQLHLDTLSDVSENGIAVRYDYLLSPAASLAGFADVAQFDLGSANDATRLFAGATYWRDMGPRLAASATLGPIHTSDAGGQTEPGYLATVTTSSRLALYTLAIGQDIIAVPGLADLALSDQITGAALMRLGDGLKLELSVSDQSLKMYDPERTRISLLSASGTLSYAVRSDLWVFAQIFLNRERSGGVTTDENRLVLGLSRSFAR